MQYWSNSVLLGHDQAFTILAEAAQMKGYTLSDARDLWLQRTTAQGRDKIYHLTEGLLFILYFLDHEMGE